LCLCASVVEVDWSTCPDSTDIEYTIEHFSFQIAEKQTFAI